MEHDGYVNLIHYSNNSANYVYSHNCTTTFNVQNKN